METQRKYCVIGGETITLKHIINVYNQKKFHWTMKEAESDARISSIFSAPDQL